MELILVLAQAMVLALVLIFVLTVTLFVRFVLFRLRIRTMVAMGVEGFAGCRSTLFRVSRMLMVRVLVVGVGKMVMSFQ